MTDLPIMALSIRQPWAWAIVTAGKDIENRSTFAVTKGAMTPRRIAVHAAKGMTQDEYQDASDFMCCLGLHCPPPNKLVRGGIIGIVTVTAVVAESKSPWFFGPRGLVLADACQIDPIPASGQLGYFPWKASGVLAEPLPWMMAAWPFKPLRSKAVNEPKSQRAPADMPLFERGK